MLNLLLQLRTDAILFLKYATVEDRMFCCYIFDSNSLNSKLLRVHLHGAKLFENKIVPFTRGNLTHATEKMFTLNESSTYPGFHLSKEINKDLLKQIQGTGRNCSTYQKFHLTGVPLIESQL